MSAGHILREEGALTTRDEASSDRELLGDIDLDKWADFSLIQAVGEDSLLADACATVVLSFEPNHPIAALSSAYVVWAGLYLERIDQAIASMQRLAKLGLHLGAATYMLDQLHDRREDFGNDFPSLETHDRASLALSIAAEPTWVNNHLALAEAYRQAGLTELSRSEEDTAARNCLGQDAAVGLGRQEIAYHEAFTGLLTDPAEIFEERDRRRKYGLSPN